MFSITQEKYISLTGNHYFTESFIFLFRQETRTNIQFFWKRITVLSKNKTKEIIILEFSAAIFQKNK